MGNIPEGYKKTEIGVIPKDWNLVFFSDIASIRKQKIDPRENDDYSFCVDLEHISQGTGQLLGSSEINRDSSVKTLFREGDVLFGKLRAYLRKYWLADRDGVCSTELWPLVSKSYFLKSDYLLQVVQTDRFINAASMAYGTHMPRTDWNIIKDYLIPLPPTKAEQTAIATALSDADALIQSLEKLIAKKRLIKQGAMQKLLKPKEGWEREPLKKVSFMKGRIGWQGLKQTEFTMNADDPFLITGMNFKDGAIRWDEVYHVSHERYQIAKEIQLKQDDVLMTKDGTIGKLLYVDNIPYPGKATLNSHLIVFRPIENSYIPKFLYYQLASKFFKDYVELSKSGTTFFGLSQEAVGDYPAFLPPLNEQTRITTIFSDMDAEIEVLEQKLAKFRMIKQGMMQKLLTGSIRLVNVEVREKTKVQVKTFTVKADSQKKRHNWEFNEAVVISVLSKSFGTQDYPLGRRRYTKLSYLLHRYAEKIAEGYLKKAAGPYNPATKYGGPEKIAQARGYIKHHSNGNYTGFITDNNIEEAVAYFNKWYGTEPLKWLEQFRYKDKDQLELLTTVDMAVLDLRKTKQEVSVSNVKALIQTHYEWRAKLEKPFFSNNNIKAAIKLSEDLFGH